VVAVGIAGLPGSGKTLITSLFVKRGFKPYTMGDVIRRYADGEGRDAGRSRRLDKA